MATSSKSHFTGMGEKLPAPSLEQSSANFFHRDPDGILGFVGHVASVATAQLCYCITKAAIDST